MALSLTSHTLRRYLYQVTYSVSVILLILWIAVFLQAGSANTYLFVMHDVITQPERLIFTLCFPVAWFVALLVLGYALKLPRFDFFNRIIVINIAVYSCLGLALSTLRLPLVSREVFVSEFLLSGSLLVVYYILSHRLLPRRVGVLCPVDVDSFESHPGLETVSVDSTQVLDDQFDFIVANLREKSDPETTLLLTALAQRRVPVHDANNLIETLWGRIPLKNLTPVEIESFTPPVLYLPLKRAGEISLILITVPLLTVVSLIIAIAIRLDSHGSVLFRQQRTGRHGKTFTMLKFRSMVMSRDEEGRFAEKQDERITRVGKVLRRLRLDELPQLWNVIRGDMSLIGPRPEQQQFTKRFDQMIPFYGFRHTIRPGVTGWAQVMYGYADSDEQTRAKLEFDFYYIKHMSAWLDVVVLFKTLRTIMIGSGAR